MSTVKTFTPRLTAPTVGSKFYTNYKYGGYCTAINVSNGNVMPNCVGYAQGRLLEEQNITKVDWKLPACNAEDWYERAQKNGLSVGQTPKLGSVIVWAKGKLHNESDGCGHVAVVEKIDSDGTITISESGWKSYNFKTEKVKPPYARNKCTLLGFVYPYCEFTDGTETVTNVITYTVQKGDTLWAIAKKYLGSGLKYKVIITYNGLKSTTLKVGQVLKIPTTT